MATKDAAADIFIPDDAIVAFGNPGADSSADFVVGVPPSSTSFAWYGRPQGGTGDWLFISDALQSATWSDDLTTGTVNGSISLDNRVDQISGKRLSSLLPTGSEIRQFYVPLGVSVPELVTAQNAGKNVMSELEEINRYVVWGSDATVGGGDILNLTIYDMMKYLVESKITIMCDMTGRKNRPRYTVFGGIATPVDSSHKYNPD